MYDLKTDPKFPHHYIISVGMTSLHNSNPGQMILKHGPIYFTNEDVKDVQGAVILSDDKLFKTSSKQALKNFGCTELASSIRGICMAASVNLCTVHHFSFEHKMPDEWFESIVNTSNSSEHNKKLLKQSRIAG